MNPHDQAPKPPPATLIVINGQRTEKTLQLEQRIAAQDEKISRAQADTAKAIDSAAEKEREQAEIKRQSRQKIKTPHWSDPFI